MDKKSKYVKCPNCANPALWDVSNRYRPFCCERCKLIDLGAWANESYRVPLKESDGNLDEQADDPLD